MPFEDVFKELPRTGTEEQQDSSDEKSDKKDEAIESVVNYFTECSDLGENFALVKQGENRYLRGLYEQHARGKDFFFQSILCESSINTGAESNNEASTRFELI